MNHGELRVATSQLSEMMHDLLQKMSLQDKDWQKALEKLFVDMDCKVAPPPARGPSPGNLLPAGQLAGWETHLGLCPPCSWTGWPWTP